MSIRVAYGNVIAHTIDGGDEYDFTPLEDRISAVVALIRSMGDMFLAVECAADPADYILSHLKDVDPDWAVRKNEHAKACFYRPSVFSYLSSNVVDLAGDTRMIDYRFVVDATGFIFDALLTHLKVGPDNGAARLAGAETIAAYAAGLTNCFLAGDFNSYDTAPGSPKDALTSGAGLAGLQVRTDPVNGGIDSLDGDPTGHWIDDIMTRSSDLVSGAAMVAAGAASDHWGWLKCVVEFGAGSGDGDGVAEGDANVSELVEIRRTGDMLHLIDARGRETIAVPHGPLRWLVTGDRASVDPDPPTDPADPGDTTTAAKLVAWHKARLGRFHYSQGAGRLNPDSSGVTDCSGLQYACYKSVMGINIGTNSRDQANNAHGGTVVTTVRADILAGTGLQKGDLIFYAHPSEDWSHVEMYMGDLKVIGISNVRQDGPRIQALSLQVNYFTGKLKVLRYV